MIEPSLPPACYTEATWFEREQKKIFGELWLLAGLTQQLSEDNAFLTRELAGVSVLVQNLDGELHAFRNSCAHRGMPLQTEEYGVRRLVCPYHGWAYNANGSVRGIPNAKIYNICDEERQRLQLQRYALRTIGNFVFVNLSPDPIPIEEQFSDDLIKLLTEMSVHFDDAVSYTRFDCDYNWKLNFENVLDWNHVQFVHSRTFAPLIELDTTGALAAVGTERSVLFAPGGALADICFHSNLSPNAVIKLKDLSFIERSSMPYTARWYSALLDSSPDPGAFVAAHIFPNINFGSIHGETFYLQQYVPMAAGRTEYHSWVFTSRLRSDVPPQPHLLWGIHHAEKRVIDEDAVLLGALQKALKSARGPGVMGDHESRQQAVGLWYMRALAVADNEGRA